VSLILKPFLGMTPIRSLLVNFALKILFFIIAIVKELSKIWKSNSSLKYLWNLIQAFRKIDTSEDQYFTSSTLWL
jgi:hypothetical protein